MIERSAVAVAYDSVGSIQVDQRRDTIAAGRAAAEAAVGSQTVIGADIVIGSWTVTAERHFCRGRSLDCTLVGHRDSAQWVTWWTGAVVERCGSELDDFGSHYA